MKYFLAVCAFLLASTAGCERFKEAASPEKIFSAYRVAVYDLGEALENYKQRTKDSALNDFDALVTQCKKGDTICEGDAKKLTLDKYKQRESSFNKAQDLHRKSVQTAHVIDVLCAPGANEACTKKVEEAMAQVPDLLTTIKELQR